MIEIMIVDDNALMRRMLKELIQGEADCRVVAEADNVDEALSILMKRDFDVVLIDISLQGRESGINLIERIRSLGKSTPILSVSLYERSLYADRLKKAGAQGYLMKQDAIDNIIPAIRSLADGKYYWSDVA
jgi:DNA-binding NarL/FixJ family response regulator